MVGEVVGRGGQDAFVDLLGDVEDAACFADDAAYFYVPAVSGDLSGAVVGLGSGEKLLRWNSGEIGRGGFGAALQAWLLGVLLGGDTKNRGQNRTERKNRIQTHANNVRREVG